jgi:hypothetical protein
VKAKNKVLQAFPCIRAVLAVNEIDGLKLFYPTRVLAAAKARSA